VVVNFGDLGEFTLEVPGPDSVGEHHGVTHAQLGDRLGGADRMKQLPAGVDGVGDRDEMLIKLSRRDRAADARDASIGDPAPEATASIAYRR
jgi:hypothetical protein